MSGTGSKDAKMARKYLVSLLALKNAVHGKVWHADNRSTLSAIYLGGHFDVREYTLKAWVGNDSGESLLSSRVERVY